MKFIVANLMISSILGLSIWYQVQEYQSNPNQQVKAGGVAVVTAMTRTPAAIPEEVRIFPRTQTKIKELTFDNEFIKNIECQGKDKLIKTKSDSIILAGKSCAQIVQINITNLSNGYTASVFNMEDKSYKTDLIPLDVGANDLSIEYIVEKNKKTSLPKKSLLTVNREK